MKKLLFSLLLMGLSAGCAGNIKEPDYYYDVKVYSDNGKILKSYKAYDIIEDKAGYELRDKDRNVIAKLSGTVIVDRIN